MSARRLPILAAAWLLTTAALGPCALFKPAEPEEPTGGALIGDYSAYDSTLATMRRAVEAKGVQNSRQLYLDALATEAEAGAGEGFRASFDPLTVSRYQAQGGVNVPSRWQRTEEERFLDVLVARNQGSGYRMTWQRYPEGGDETIGDARVTVFRRYDILLVETSTGGTQPYASGWATLTLVRAGTSWRLVEWVDGELTSAPPNTSSFGLLRLESQ